MENDETFRRTYWAAIETYGTTVLPVLEQQLEDAEDKCAYADAQLEKFARRNNPGLSTTEETIRHQTYMFWWEIWASYQKPRPPHPLWGARL